MRREEVIGGLVMRAAGLILIPLLGTVIFTLRPSTANPDRSGIPRDSVRR